MKIDFYPLKLYFIRPSIIVLVGLSLALNLATWLRLWWQIPLNEQDLFLHYNILFGVDYIGKSWEVFKLPLLGTAILLFNVFFGWTLYKHNRFMAQLLNFINLFCQIFLFISASLLIFLNT